MSTSENRGVGALLFARPQSAIGPNLGRGRAGRALSGVVVMALVLGIPPTGWAQISKGNRILIHHGLQVQGMVTAGDVFHLDTYREANYTAIHWLWDSNPLLMGPAPGFPWARWVGNETNMPPQGGEAPYLGRLVALQLGDEWHLNDAATRTRAVNWFNAVRADFPEVILYMNSYGGQVGDAQLGDFINRARPDMICFDRYPWRSDYGTRLPIGGPPTSWYSELRRYREHAKANNLPLGTYVQTFHAVQDYDQTVYRDPSPSELRLNHAGALAFNAKVLVDFTYNTGASSLFTSPGGDSNPTSLLSEKADAARRARNLGKALVRLKPIADVPFPDLHTTSMMFLRGRNSGGTPNAVPIGFVADPEAPGSYTDWVFGRNDPFLSGWAVMNKGIRNGGQRGDVIVSWFKPLDESFDGPYHTDERYLMVVNGLTDPAGTSADCRQEIRLDFSFSDGVTGVVVLDPTSGQLETNTLPVVNSKRQLLLNLGGGDAALFKFADGAPFVGFPLPAVPLSTLISTGAVWKYNATGIDLGTAWRSRDFNDSAWPSGPAKLGSNDNPRTTINIGPTNARFLTAYFRHSFVVSNAATLTNLFFEVLRDDGAAVYLNGLELFRMNLPETGEISFTNRALSGVGGADESLYFPANIAAFPLVEGTNVLAVELHQSGPDTSDAGFDLGLSAAVGPPRTPRLGLSRSNDWLTLTWPSFAGANALVTATNLAPPVEWSPAPAATFTNGVWTVAASADTNAPRFFRLIVPLL